MWTRKQVEQAGRSGAILGSDAPNGTLLCRVLDRSLVFVDPHDQSLTPHLLKEGMWEAWITTWYLNFLTTRTGAVAVMDVGANVGYYSVLAAAEGCPVKAFEPQPRLAELLKLTATHNGYDIQVHQTAVGAASGSGELYIPPTLLGGASLMGNPLPDQQIDPLPVDVRALDEYWEWKPGAELLIKIDAEGAEEHVWRGMQKLWTTRRVTMLLEWEWARYQDPEGFAQELMTSAAGRLAVLGYDGYPEPLQDMTQLQQRDWITLIAWNYD